MSSENLHTNDAELFRWQSDDEVGGYVLATYRLATGIGGEQAALGIAREQSICATQIHGLEMPGDLESYCARVVRVEEDAPGPGAIAEPYFLNTPVYGRSGPAAEPRYYRVVIAYPTKLFGHSLSRLWNTVFGEVHRLGYLHAASLVDLQLPGAFAAQFPGPTHGVAGLREQLGVQDRPVLCRSMRPASGLTTQMMLELNRRVLTGGFDAIKDDELTYDSARSPFAERIAAMVAMKREVEDATGERKLYFANIIDDHAVSLEMAEQASEAGVDGVLVSAAVQGLSIITEVKQRTGLLVLAHNSSGDVMTRSRHWGASDAVMATMQRLAGADLVVSPGPFATPYQDESVNAAFLNACRAPLGGHRSPMPIVQGGKQPEFLDRYAADVGGVDYFLIVATWLDSHPEGIEFAARAFREAAGS